MAADYALPTRAAILKALKADVPFTDLIGKASIYPATVPASPAWPFSRFASMIASPFLASCLDSSTFRITLQAFSKGVYAGSTLQLPAEDHVMSIASAMKDALDGKTLVLSTGDKLRLQWVQTLSRIDGDEASAWMASVIFNGEVAG